MTKKGLIILQIALGLLISNPGVAQEQPPLGFVTNHLCQEMAMEVTELIPVMYRQGDIDSLFKVLHDWDLVCGLSEPLLRTYILHQISSNTFSEDFLPDNILDYLHDYKEVASSKDPDRFLDYYSWEYDRIHPTFSTFTTELAEHLGGYEDLSETERFFVDFYSNNFEASWRSLYDKKLENTRLGTIFHKRMVAAYDNLFKPTAWLSMGAWRPGGNLGLLGNHPQIGIGVGASRKGFFADLNLALAFLESKNEYEVVYMYQRHLVRNFTNLSISLSAGVQLSFNRRPFLKVGLSAGYESILAINPGPELDDPGKYINSFLLGPLLEFSLPVSKKLFLGFYTRYHFMNFDNQTGTVLSGNVQWLGVKVATKLFTPNNAGESRW